MEARISHNFLEKNVKFQNHTLYTKYSKEKSEDFTSFDTVNLNQPAMLEGKLYLLHKISTHKNSTQCRKNFYKSSKFKMTHQATASRLSLFSHMVSVVAFCIFVADGQTDGHLVRKQ